MKRIDDKLVKQLNDVAQEVSKKKKKKKAKMLSDKCFLLKQRSYKKSASVV